jgi:hypothetical protein
MFQFPLPNQVPVVDIRLGHKHKIPKDESFGIPFEKQKTKGKILFVDQNEETTKRRNQDIKYYTFSVIKIFSSQFLT